MTYPAFFEDVRKITLYDPLAEFLGAAAKGLIEYSYGDVVKLAGHSCPTVAGAYLMTLKGLRALYGNETPERGAIRVRFRDNITDGVTGVMANVASLITGATQDSGFKGIAGRFDRRNLLFFGADMEGLMAFERVDTGAAVEVNYRSERITPDPRMRNAMQKALGGDATRDEQALFAELWQERVRRILIDYIDDPEMIVVR